jgi:hypothetical protein
MLLFLSKCCLTFFKKFGGAINMHFYLFSYNLSGAYSTVELWCAGVGLPKFE